MLRMSFMPSDFHPILLILGTPEQLQNLVAAFETFSEQGGLLSLNENGLFSTDTTVSLEECALEGSEKPGLWQVSAGSTDLVWRLPKRFAWIFANEVANLANSGEVAGSVTLECDQLGEIRAKVSIGEWEDSYLTDEFR
ncbi:MAG: hypothetical protein CL534_04080 [Ahrensia sp.]|nr:hypothetical protein [Ahrensia sp.]